MQQISRVREYLQRTLAACDMTDELRLSFIQALSRPGRILHPHTLTKWPAFVLETCYAFEGDPAAAVIAVAAVECVVAASDVVDDLIDDTQGWGADQARRLLNMSLALGQFAQWCLRDLPAILGWERTHRISVLIAEGMLGSSSGQDLDLCFESMSGVSEELAHEMTRRKSGSLVAMACRIGASTATSEPGLLDLVGAFGTHVGIVAQLINDIAGVDPAIPVRGSDLYLRKKTLPVAYALCCAAEEDLTTLSAWADNTALLVPEHEQHIATLVRDLGALHYTWIIADAHRREAMAVVRRLVQVTRRHEVVRLGQLIPSVRARRT